MWSSIVGGVVKVVGLVGSLSKDTKGKAGEVVDRHLSKKFSAAAGLLLWLSQAPLPEDMKAKYMTYLGAAYLFMQGVVDAVEKFTGRKLNLPKMPGATPAGPA
jgi:hypothetical protein